jgi:O-antigen/teichoic acid export membrane protein
MSLTAKLLARNTALNLAAQTVPLLVAVGAVPPLIAQLGHERFGLLGIAWVFLSYFTYLDLGLSRAVTRFAADALGRQQPEQVPAIVTSAAAIQLGIGVAGALLVSLTAPLLTSLLLGGDPRSAEETAATFRVLAAGIPIVLVSGTFRGVLEAAQRFDLLTAVTVPASSFNYVLPLVGAKLGWGLPAIVAGLVLGRFIVLAAYATIAEKIVPGSLRIVSSRGGRLKTLLSFGAWSSVSNVLSPVFDGLDRVLLGALNGMPAVGAYTVPQEIALRARILPNSLAATLFPAFSSWSAGEQRQRVGSYYSRAWRSLMVVMAPLAITAMAASSDLFRLWLGESYAVASAAAFQLLAIGMLFNALAYVPFAYLHGVNRPDLPAKFHLVELLAFLGLASWFMPRWGAAGAAAAWSGRAALDAVLLFGAARRLGAASPETEPGLARRRVSIAYALLLFLAVPAVTWLPGAFYRLAAAAALGSLAAAGLWTLAFDPRERRRLIEVVLRRA